MMPQILHLIRVCNKAIHMMRLDIVYTKINGPEIELQPR